MRLEQVAAGASILLALTSFPVAVAAQPFATPDDVVTALTTAYDERDLVLYDTVLDDDFAFFFAPEDVVSLGVPAVIDRVTDFAVTELVFTGRLGLDPSTGLPVGLVLSIDISLVPIDAEWVEEDIPEFAGTLARSYTVDMLVVLPNASILSVMGIQRFHVGPIPAKGTAQPGYQLVAWRDLGIVVARAATEDATWGLLKSLFLEEGSVPTSLASMTRLKQQYGR